MRNPARLWLVVSILWTGVILYGSTSGAERFADSALGSLIGLFAPTAGPDDGTPPDYFWEKKAAHVVLFATLAFFLSRVSEHAAALTPAVIVLIGTGIGVCSEALQFFFPTREPSLRDVLINASATCAGVLAFHPSGRRQTRPASQVHPL